MLANIVVACKVHTAIIAYKVHTCAADQNALEQEASDHMHDATWQPHNAEPCGFNGGHGIFTADFDTVCEDSNSMPQCLTGKPLLAIAIGKTNCNR